MRQLSIAKELIKWADAMPRLIERIDDVLKLPFISETQAVEIESIAERVETLFLGIREAVNDHNYNRLVASVDRLREEIVAGDATLDRLLNRR
jgi:hypothetical protein